MKRSFTILVFQMALFSFCLEPLAYGQPSRLDSLLSVLNTAQQDTVKVNVWNDLFLEYEYTDDEKAKECLDKAIALSGRIGYKRGEGVAYSLLGFYEEDKGNNEEALKNYKISLKLLLETNDRKNTADAYDYIGISNYNMGNYSEALKNNFISLEMRKAMNDKSGVAASYTNIGNVYLFLGNYPEALKHHLASLKLEEELGDKRGITYSYWGVGNVYYKQRNFEQALKNFESYLKLAIEIDDKNAIASSYNNMGNVHLAQYKLPLALNDFQAALKGYNEFGSQSGASVCYVNIGTVYQKQSETEEDPKLRAEQLAKALENYETAFKMEEITGDKAGMASNLNAKGIVLVAQKKFMEAEVALKKALILAKEIGYLDNLEKTYEILTLLDEAKGNYKGAYENHKLFIQYRDSLDNEETRKQTIQSQMTFDFEKKEAIAEAEHKKELENHQLLAEEKSRKQKIIILFVICGLLLVLAFAGFIFRSLRITRKQKDIIEKQKNLVEQQKVEVEQQKTLVEEKQKEIIDSITYARRIQNSLLPTERYIDRILKRLQD
jgi:tetratricopeptide (TPR) repeat protein